MIVIITYFNKSEPGFLLFQALSDNPGLYSSD